MSTALAADAQTLATLETALFRFATTNDDQLEAVVKRALPKILLLFRVESNESELGAQIREKLLLIVGHINKRLTVLPQLQLPVDELVAIYADVQYVDHGIMLSFALSYIEKAFVRASYSAEMCDFVPTLLQSVRLRPGNQQKILLHLLLRACGHLRNRANLLSTVEEKVAYFSFFAINRALLLDFFLDVMLYSPGAANLLLAAATEEKNSSGNNAALPGMSSAALERVSYTSASTAANVSEWNAVRLSVLALLQTIPVECVPEAELYAVVLVASAHGSGELMRLGDHMLKKLKHVTLEDPRGVLSVLLKLYVGDGLRSPVAVPIKERIIALLLKSEACANQKLTLKVVFDCLFACKVYRMQVQGLTLLSWVIARKTQAHLAPLASTLQTALFKLLATLNIKPPAPSATAFAAAASALSSSSSSSAPTSPAQSAPLMPGQQAHLRGITYNVLGQLVLRCPVLVSQNIKVAMLFFGALEKEKDNDVLQNVQEGLGLVRQAYLQQSPGILNELFIFSAQLVGREGTGIRVLLNAVRTINAVADFSNAQARYICASFVSHSHTELREEAVRGLDPVRFAQARWHHQLSRKEGENGDAKNDPDFDVTQSTETLLQGMIEKTSFPTFRNWMILLLGALHGRVADNRESVSIARMDPYFVAALINFGSRCLWSDARKSSEAQSSSASMTVDRNELQDVHEFRLTILNDENPQGNLAQERKRVRMMRVEVQQMLHADGNNSTFLHCFRSMLEQSFTTAVSEMRISSGVEHGLQHTGSSILLDIVRACPQYVIESHASDLEWLLRAALSCETRSQMHISKMLLAVMPFVPLSRVQSILEQVEQELDKCFDDVVTKTPPSDVKKAAKTVKRTVRHVTRAHGCVLVIGACVTELVRRNESKDDAILRRCTARVVDLLNPKSTATGDNMAAVAACGALAWMGSAGALVLPKGMTAADVIKRLLNLTVGSSRKANRLVEHAILAMGLMAEGDIDNTAMQKSVVQGLMKMSRVKHEEVQLAIGRTLARAVLCNAQLLEEILDKILQDLMTKGSQVQRSSASIWLNCLVLFVLPEPRPEEMDVVIGQDVVNCRALLVKHALLIQKSLVNMLLDKSESVQASAAKGLSFLFQRIRDRNIRAELTRHMAATFSRGPAVLGVTERRDFDDMVSSVLGGLRSEQVDDVDANSADATGETEANAESKSAAGNANLNTDPASLSEEKKAELLRRKQRSSEGFETYAELCSLAAQIGKPSLIYLFLDLSVGESMWRDVAHTTEWDTQAISIGDLDSKKLMLLIPALYMHLHNPNEKIRDSIAHLWKLLVPKPVQAIADHFHAIVEHLLVKLVSRQTPNRTSACMALGSVLSRRGIADLEPHLASIWLKLFKVLDDFDDNTRKAAIRLSKVLTNVCVRLCDPLYSNADSATRTLDIIIPLLLTTGIRNPAKDCIGVTVAAILRLTEVTGRPLAKFVSRVLCVLLEGLSTLEPQAFSYLQFHVSSMDMSHEQLERLRVKLLERSPLNAAIQKLQKLVTAAEVDDLISSLTDQMQGGVGLQTLVSCAKVVTALATDPVFKSHWKDHSQVDRLLFVLQDGLTDQSPVLRSEYARTLGYVCGVVELSKVGKVIHKVIGMFSKSDEFMCRCASGYAARELVRHGGRSVEYYAKELIPFAFVGMNEEDEKIKPLFAEVWSSLTTGMQSGMEMHLPELITSIEALLAQEVWRVRKVALSGLQMMLEKIDCKKFAPFLDNVLTSILRLVPGRIWTGKEILLTVLKTLLEKHGGEGRVSQTRVKEIFATLADQCETVTRQIESYDDKVYLRSLMDTLGGVSLAFGNVVPLTQEAMDTIGAVVEDQIGRLSEKKKPDPVLLAKAFTAMGNAFPASSGADGDAQVVWTEVLFARGLRSGLPWNVRLAILGSSKQAIVGIISGRGGREVEQLQGFLEGCLESLDDEKYSAVRHGALRSLSAATDADPMCVDFRDFKARLLRKLAYMSSSDSDSALANNSKELCRKLKYGQ